MNPLGLKKSESTLLSSVRESTEFLSFPGLCQGSLSYFGENLPHCQTVSHAERPGIEHKPPMCEADE